MGTSTVSPPRRRAGQYVQERADRLDFEFTAIVGGAVAVPLVGVLLGARGLALAALLLLALVAILGAERVLKPEIGRWRRGAEGERKVGAILEGLDPGWHVLHDVSLGRGNIDHVLVGPGGLFTVETKANGGRIAIDHIYSHMLSQAYGEKKVLERVSGQRVQALLVFSQAYLVGSVPAHRRGVTVLPARKLADYLGRRRPLFSDDEADEIGERLRLALEVDAS
jgi:hypothetical protein